MAWLVAFASLGLLSAAARAADRPPIYTGPDGLTLDVNLRVNMRAEARTNAGAASNPTADTWEVEEGVRLGIAGGYKALTVVGQVQDVRAWGQGALSNRATTGLHQGYIEVGGQANRLVSGFVRLGRQEIVYGNARFFHKSPWHIAGRAFEAVRAQLNVGNATFEAAYMMLGTPRTFSITGADGMPADVRTGGDHTGYADIGYAFHDAAQFHAAVIVQRVGPDPGNATRDEFFAMPGVRLTGKPLKGVQYDAEAWLQRGSDGDRDHRAWSAAGSVQYTAPIELGPGAKVLYEIASGEACEGDPTQDDPCAATVSRDFDQLDGARHVYRGWMDIFAGSNLRDLAVSGFVEPSRRFAAWATYHFVQLDRADGRWYRLDGETAWGLGWDPANGRNTLGHEVDFQITYRPWKYLSIMPGYAVFAMGPAARAIMRQSKPMQFAYLWFVAEF